jgi:hypothetical protein
VVALDKLVWTLAANAQDLAGDDMQMLLRILTGLRDEEAELRNKSRGAGISFSFRCVRTACLRTDLAAGASMPEEDPTSDEPDIRRRCVACQQPCSLSTVVCACVPDRAACPRHHAQLCRCPPGKKCLVYWRSVEELSGLLEGLRQLLPGGAAGAGPR